MILFVVCLVGLRGRERRQRSPPQADILGVNGAAGYFGAVIAGAGVIRKFGEEGRGTIALVYMICKGGRSRLGMWAARWVPCKHRSKVTLCGSIGLELEWAGSWLDLSMVHDVTPDYWSLWVSINSWVSC